MIDFFFNAYLQYQRDNVQALDFLSWVDNVYDQTALEAQFDASWWGSIITDKILRRE
jgi:hypothetical protein